MKLFHETVLPAARCVRFRRLKDAAAVVAAIASDPQGIGFVDAWVGGRGNKQVRVLAIQSGAGAGVLPKAESILDGTYPFSRPVLLYVSPTAGETTKDFAKFIVSGKCDALLAGYGLVGAGK